MTPWEVADRNPWLAFGLAMFAYWIANSLFRCLFLCVNRLARSRNIKHHGWPPTHLDADGDFRPEPDDGEEG